MARITRVILQDLSSVLPFVLSAVILFHLSRSSNPALININSEPTIELERFDKIERDTTLARNLEAVTVTSSQNRTQNTWFLHYKETSYN